MSGFGNECLTAELSECQLHLIACSIQVTLLKMAGVLHVLPTVGTSVSAVEDRDLVWRTCLEGYSQGFVQCEQDGFG